MRIRQNHPIADRLKVLGVLLGVLLLLGSLAGKGSDSSFGEQTASIETLLETARKPVGNTMYIWGGGWDAEDEEAGATSTRIGVSPQWEKFAGKQDETYDFEEHRFERENGLDCSGYVGWVIYNTFETESGKSGYVTTSTDLAESLAKRGWGVLIQNPREFLPGDIVSMDGHVWISLGTCRDGSVLLVHSSPPGVSVCGTSTAAEEKGEESIAVKLATAYMTNYHPKWQKQYPNRMVSDAYLKNVTVFRWNEAVMQDAKSYQRKCGEEIMELFSISLTAP